MIRSERGIGVIFMAALIWSFSTSGVAALRLVTSQISWAEASLLGTFAADEIGERESGFGRYCCKSLFGVANENS